MPIVHIYLAAGRTQSIKDELARRVTQAVAESLQADPVTIRVLLHEVPAADWYADGASLAHRALRKE